MVTGFFNKLKSKLFNSSSKFTKNLDEAVNEVSETNVEANIEKKFSVEKPEKNDDDSFSLKHGFGDDEFNFAKMLDDPPKDDTGDTDSKTPEPDGS